MPYAIEEFRSLVPSLKNNDIIYLNSSFQPPMNKIIADAFFYYINEALEDVNPKAKWYSECQTIKYKLAKLINCDPKDLVYTRDTTESSQLFQKSLKFKKGDNVVLLRDEFPSTLAGWMSLLPDGLKIKFIEVNQKSPVSHDANTFKDYVDENTIAIGISSIMFNNGLRNDVKSICDTYRPRGIHVLVDAMQEVGFGCINVQEWGPSAISFGTNKALACPTGLGCLYVNPDVLNDLKKTPPNMTAASFSNMSDPHLAPYPYECFKSAKRYEHTNMAMIQCLALGKYLDFMNEVGMENIQNHLEELSTYLRFELAKIKVSTVDDDGNLNIIRSPHSNLVILESPEWSQYFTDNNVMVSRYSAGFRISFGLYNNRQDIDKFIAIVKRGLSEGFH